MPYSDALAFKSPPAPVNKGTLPVSGKRQASLVTHAVAPVVKSATLAHAPTTMVHATTSTIMGKAADDKIVPVFAGGVPKNNPIAGTGRDSLVGASGVGGVIVKATAGTPTTPYYTGSGVGVASLAPKALVSSGGKVTTSLGAVVPATSITGGSGVTSKVGYQSSPLTNPDQGGGVGGISPATNTGSGFDFAKLAEIGALAAVAFLLIVYMRKHKRR